MSGRPNRSFGVEHSPPPRQRVLPRAWTPAGQYSKVDLKRSPSAAEAKEKLIAKGWSPGDVMAMLERAGQDACRPDDLPEIYGLREGLYHLSPEQAQAILDLRLHRLTGLETEKLQNEYK